MGTSIYSMIWFGTGSVWTGIALCFPFFVTIRIGTAFLFPFLNTIWVWDYLPYRVLYWFWTGSVPSRECLATVFKKLQSRREALGPVRQLQDVAYTVEFATFHFLPKVLLSEFELSLNHVNYVIRIVCDKDLDAAVPLMNQEHCRLL